MSGFIRWYKQTETVSRAAYVLTRSIRMLKPICITPVHPGSRMGTIADLLGDKLPEGVEGLHFHTLCESTSFDLEKTLSEVEKRFGRFLPHTNG